MFSSWVLERIAIGDTHRLHTGTTTVGRHSSSVIRIIDSHYVSRHHAEIVVSGDDRTVTIKDLNSVNGIYINRALHQSATVTLTIGDKIGIGVSINAIEEEDELTLPIYELKYVPITRARSAAVQNLASSIKATQPKQHSGENRIKTENDNLPSTSRNISNAPKPQIIQEILIISDDDDDGDDHNHNGHKKLTEDNTDNKKEKINQNITCHEIPVKQEKLTNATSMQLASIKKDQTMKPTEVAIDESSIYNNKRPPETNIPVADENSSFPENPKQPSLHIPMICSLKKELIHTVSVNVRDIFGNIDDNDDMKNKLKEMNPLVYNELTGKPILPVANVDNHLNIGACIILSDDDGLEEDHLGFLIPSTSNSTNEHKNRMEATKSPNIFETSLNGSKDDDAEEEQDMTKQQQIKTKTDNQKEADEHSITTTDNVDLEDYTSYIRDAGAEDLEDEMFSQVLINDMKAELEHDVFTTDFPDELPPNEVSFDKTLQLPSTIKQEPDLDRNASLLIQMENSCWVISDDEDYDAELETKVSDWSNKIFSQSFSNISMSQVYDIDTSNLTDDDDDDDDADANEQENEINGDDDFNFIDDDIDNIADLYNNNNNENVTEKNIDEDFQNFKERLRILDDKVDDKQEEENQQEKLETAHEKDLGENEKIFQVKSSEDSNKARYKLKEFEIVITNTKEISEAFADEKMAKKTECTLQNNNSNVVKKSIQMKSPEDPQEEENEQEKVDAHEKDLVEIEKQIQVKKLEIISKDNITQKANKEKKISVADKSNEARFKLKDLRIVLNPANEIPEALKDGHLPKKTESPLEINDPLAANNSIKEKSPDNEMLPQVTEAESPLIRIRRKSWTKVNRISNLSSSSEDEEGDFAADKPIHAEHSNNEKPQSKENTNNKSTIRPPPMIIDAPALPKCKGKLRGVSAVKPPTTLVSHINTSKHPLHEKITSIRDKIICDSKMKDLKRKWVEKSSVSRKCDKERDKMIKESRKDKLKELAEKNKCSANDTLKRKSSVGVDYEEIKAKKAKVKVTTNNRGAFLASADPPQTRPKSKDSFKIPKVISKKVEEAKKDSNEAPIHRNEPLKRSNSTDEVKKKDPIKRSISIDATFSQQISIADELLLKKVIGNFKKPDSRPLPPRRSTLKSNSDYSNTSSHFTDTKGTVCKEAVAARALRTTNKITFASMEKNLTDTEACKEKLDTISSKRCGDNIPSILAKADRVRPKKTVRFNDTPLIHYIERICGASRRVDGKDILPQTTNKDRRQMIRRNFPIIDNTDKIISKILHWSNEWLIKRDAAADAASEVVYPMPTHFSSFDHYKSILFPLMKLEFASLLERQYQLTLCAKKYIVKVEYVTENKDRLVLVTKFHFENRQQLDNTRFDLVILESKQMNNSMFAYLTSVRKGPGSCNTMVFEILTINMTKDFFIGIKEFRVRPVIDNVRVEFGAFNAVYQLEATPLFNKILNPLELLHFRHPLKKKPIYRGCDELNEKQKQVLLNTYSRIIDELTPNISLLQGPPGTGKSCVITNLALQTLYGDEVRYLDKKILICAQSNAAVDVIAGKLFDISMRMRVEKRFRLIRYGLPEKINPSVNAVSLIHIVEQELLKKLKVANANVQMENKESLKNQILQLEAQIAEMFKRNVKGTVEEDILLEKQRQLQLMRNISNQLTRPDDERSLYSWYLCNANIVCATLSSCVKLSQYVNYFDICIIDEATQSTEPWTLLPLRFGINSLVLVGDTQQLPATILSKKANELGLGKSMFTRIQNCLDNIPSGATGSNGLITPSIIICSLQTQYRMNPEICRWPNAYFYRNQLINGQITLKYKSPITPFSVLNLAYSQNDYCKNGQITNNLEAEFVAKLLKALDGLIPNNYNSYGVITPYAHHRTTLESSIRSLGLSNIMVNTIDSYQGLEKDVIIISNARTSGIGFLSNPQRLNVALTRPKKCLILCGNFKSLEIVPAWRCLLQSARERNVYFEISTSCVNDMKTNVIDKIRLKN